MALSFLLKIKGVDLDTLGLELLLANPHSRPAVLRESIGVPGLYGAYAFQSAPGELKRVPVSLTIPSTVAIESRRAILDVILDHLSGKLDLEWGDTPGRVQLAHFDSGPIIARWESVAWTHGPVVLASEFIIEDAVFRAKDISHVPISTTAERVPLGTLPSWPRFYLNGALSNTTITLKNGITGATIGSVFTIAGTTGAGTVTEIDCRRPMITTWDTTTGARVEELDIYSTGDFPVFDPTYGTTSFPLTVETSHTGIAFARYRKRWE